MALDPDHLGARDHHLAGDGVPSSKTEWIILRSPDSMTPRLGEVDELAELGLGRERAFAVTACRGSPRCRQDQQCGSGPRRGDERQRRGREPGHRRSCWRPRVRGADPDDDEGHHRHRAGRDERRPARRRRRRGRGSTARPARWRPSRTAAAAAAQVDVAGGVGEDPHELARARLALVRELLGPGLGEPRRARRRQRRRNQPGRRARLHEGSPDRRSSALSVADLPATLQQPAWRPNISACSSGSAWS